MAQRPVDLPEPLRVLWRRRGLLRVPWIAAVVIGLGVAVLTPSVYESPVVLTLERLPAQEAPLPTESGTALQADMLGEQARSLPFLRGVIAASGIARDPAIRARALRTAKRHPGATQDDVVDAYLAAQLRGAIAVRKARGNEFTVTVADRDRARARALAQVVGEQLVAASRIRQIQQVGQLQEARLEQLQTYRRNLEESEGRLAAFRRNIGATPEVGPSVGGGNVDRARAAEQKAVSESEDLQRRVDALREQLAGRARDEDLRALTSRTVATIASQRATLERRLAAAIVGDSTQEDPGAIQLSIVHKQSELATTLTHAAATTLPKLPEAVRELVVYYRLAEADLAGVGARRDWLARRVFTYERRAVMAPEQQAELQRLTEDVARSRAVRDSFARLSAAAQLAEAFESAKLSGRFAIAQPALWPGRAARPNRPLILFYAVLIGGVVGAATVLIVERQDRSVKNAEEVGSLVGLPVLGALPRVEGLVVRRPLPGPLASLTGPAPTLAREHGLLSGLKLETPLGRELRRIYLELGRSSRRQLPRTLAVTGATRGEGTSTVAAGLAITLARELRQNTLLVDFDVRTPGLHLALGLPSSSWGVAQVLAERRFETRFVRTTAQPHLDFLPAGKSERSADELLDAERVAWFVREAASRYMMVVLDCAPNLAAPDALLAGRAVEGVVFVVKAGSTTRRAAEAGVRQQREWRDNVLGVVINDAGQVLPPFSSAPAHDYDVRGELAGGES